MCRWPLWAPTPLWSILWPIIDPILVTFKQISNFRDLNLGTFYFYELTHFFKLNEEHFLFSYSTNILLLLLTVDMKNCLTPKHPKMCDPILVTLLKMRPHYSQSSRENATPSSGTSPLASYKKVPPPRATIVAIKAELIKLFTSVSLLTRYRTLKCIRFTCV